MSIVKLYECIEEREAKGLNDLSDPNTINDMMGFSPFETVERNVRGGKNKIFRVWRLV